MAGPCWRSDVSDAGNAVVLARYHDRPIQLQMGNRHLRHRLDVFLSYIEAWRSEFGPLRSVDLRFDKQVTVMPRDGRGGKRMTDKENTYVGIDMSGSQTRCLRGGQRGERAPVRELRLDAARPLGR